MTGAMSALPSNVLLGRKEEMICTAKKILLLGCIVAFVKRLSVFCVRSSSPGSLFCWGLKSTPQTTCNPLAFKPGTRFLARSCTQAITKICVLFSPPSSSLITVCVCADRLVSMAGSVIMNVGPVVRESSDVLVNASAGCF